jgi:hypothetical protein
LLPRKRATACTSQYIPSIVGFEVFTAVVMKSIIFWDMTPCSPLSFNRRFGGTSRLHLQGRRNRFSKTSKEAGLLAGFAEPFSSTEDGDDIFLRNVGWNSTDYTASYPRRWYSLYLYFLCSRSLCFYCKHIEEHNIVRRTWSENYWLVGCDV